MRMSAKAEYAVRAMIQLATVDTGELVKTDDLAKAQHLAHLINTGEADIEARVNLSASTIKYVLHLPTGETHDLYDVRVVVKPGEPASGLKNPEFTGSL